MVGHACADDDAVDGGTVVPGLRHEAFPTDLHLPQVGVEEHGVEFRVHALVEQPGEFFDIGFEEFRGDLPAAGEFGPVAGVCRRGHDFGVDGSGGHAGQHHGGAAGQFSEFGHQAGAAGAVGQGGGVVAVGSRQFRGLVSVEKQGLTVGVGHGQGGGPGAGKDFFGEEGHTGVGADVEKPAGTGGHGVAHLFDPVNGRDHDFGGDFPGQFLVESGLSGPQHYLVHGGDHGGVVESYLHV